MPEQVMPEQVLILGGAGFIGSSLAIGLRQRYPQWKITCLDNLKRRGSELNLSRFKQHGIQFVHGDIRSPSDLDPAALSVDTIIDCSAEPSVLAGFSSPSLRPGNQSSRHVKHPGAGSTAQSLADVSLDQSRLPDRVPLCHQIGRARHPLCDRTRAEPRRTL